MIRPEVRQGLYRWREVLVGLGISALLIWWASSSFGVVAWIAWGFVALSAVFLFAAVQRARFASDSGGFGVVEIDEGVVSYMTPYAGGQMEIAALSAVLLIPAGRGSANWQLEAFGQTPLLIPLDAFGAEKLFDVFVQLDGIETERMLRQIKSTPDKPVVVWKKRTIALH